MINEAPVWISLNGRRRIVLTCAPAAPEALAVGHLLAEGWIDRAADIRSLRAVAGPGGCHGVEAELDPLRVELLEALRRHQTEHGCGLRHVLDCVPAAERARTPAAAGPARAAPDLAGPFRALFAVADEASPAGGVHAAALCDGSALKHAAVDVARHCAVDRALGLAALAGEAFGEHGLIVTARVSGSMALKAARAGVSWVASRSFATPLARELAAAFDVAVHEQAVRRQRRQQ
jgi:FdhD protein